MRDFGTPSEEAMNNEWPDSQTIPDTQDLEKFDEMEMKSILNEEWPDKKKPFKTSVKQKVVTVEEDEETSTEEEENEENERKKRREMSEHHGKDKENVKVGDTHPKS